ncbi:MAG: DUF5004 domain-containing protein [Bacteroidetes bacterium]|nr:MAG: DUF5004 domain-containing protein [Bacteroidota bacterium]
MKKLFLLVGIIFLVQLMTLAQNTNPPKKAPPQRYKELMKNGDLEGEWTLSNIKAQIPSSTPFQERKNTQKNVDKFKAQAQGKLKMNFQKNGQFVGTSPEGEKTTGTWILEPSSNKLMVKTSFGTEYHEVTFDDAKTTLTTSRGSANTQKIYMIFKKNQP